MHGRAGEIVVIPHTDHVRVGELVIKERVGIGAIAIVGTPALAQRALVLRRRRANADACSSENRKRARYYCPLLPSI